jgi:hypothetical protein
MARRSRILPPEMPEDPYARHEEAKRFLEVLSDDLIDYDHYNVYNSVFRKRVDQYLENINFSDLEGMAEKQVALAKTVHTLGLAIQASDTTKTRDFLAFFKSILAFMESVV